MNTKQIIFIFTVVLSANITIVINNASAITDKELTNINNVIKDGLNECSNLQNNNCISVISTLDQICQVAYFPNCFGDQWSNFEQYFKSMIQQGHYPDERYKDDPYFTLNNHHYGSE